ncbi:uncharacterized protein LOC133195297 [Saccostrea echinata]|uniref:uncharacterized protein LOC133195297 n=1 Tax=Saccostrea echinata TaxID=191078 RepID=UPI002A7F503C|nr:uncharacterized protein LOC133195297 [Saccostrea echinata]
MASFVALLYTICIFSTIVTVESQISTVFSNPVKNFPLGNIEFDPQTDAFFVSAKNVLYKFNREDFQEELKNITGPQVGCKTENGKSCDDHNSVMVVTSNGLITCSTSNSGRCIRRNKENLKNISPDVTNIALVSDVDASAVGIFLNIRVRDKQKNKSIVLFAKQYSPIIALQKLDRSAIFSVLPTLKDKAISSDLKESGIFDVFLKKIDGVPMSKMDYRVVMENEEFVFLLVNQDSQAKLVKLCKSIDSENPKRVYEDIPIACSGKDGTNYTHVVHGTFVSEKRYLVALFSTSPSTVTSAVCVYSKEEIYEAYLDSRKDRFECPKHDLQQRDEVFDDVSKFNIDKCVNLSEDEVIDDGTLNHN